MYVYVYVYIHINTYQPCASVSQLPAALRPPQKNACPWISEHVLYWSIWEYEAPTWGSAGKQQSKQSPPGHKHRNLAHITPSISFCI